ncbi:zincin-like metallopeptidase domain-containing protein [Spirosoma arboris]|uniref:zincin-like metallopeptidase domain-containing protein n=1 Tax=Spirosoma arboris TaxID=2682092 RepID=UPI001D111085|nr:zincin-like metallopeptidase domain-containing protein [Spirosoma arboris]
MIIGKPIRCGIIFHAALCVLCRYRHKIHWTKHPKRLDRDLGRKQYGDEGYAKEELVAELGACFLAADLGFEPMPETKHAAYIQSWLQVLKDDKRFIFSAASHAQKAVEYIHNLQCP